MERPIIDDIIIEGAKLLFRNFAGAPTKFNPKGGDRTFAVLIKNHEYAEALIANGWNIKRFKERETDDPELGPDYYLPVSVNFTSGRPPRIELITRRKKTRLDEETIASLDYADITNADLIIHPSFWEVGDKSGIKAYLKAGYITIQQDEFSEKYADLEESF